MIGDRRQETIDRKETGFHETNTRHKTNKTRDKQDTRQGTGDKRQEKETRDTRLETGARRQGETRDKRGRR